MAEEGLQFEKEGKMNKQLFGNVFDLDTPIYFGSFSSAQDVFDAFELKEADQMDVDILYANYDTPPYEGYAFVIFLKDGKLYEVNASHCSCNGLEECWSPEETSAIALMSRPNVPDAAKANLRKVFKNLMSFL